MPFESFLANEVVIKAIELGATCAVNGNELDVNILGSDFSFTDNDDDELVWALEQVQAWVGDGLGRQRAALQIRLEAETADIESLAKQIRAPKGCKKLIEAGKVELSYGLDENLFYQPKLSFYSDKIGSALGNYYPNDEFAEHESICITAPESFYEVGDGCKYVATYQDYPIGDGEGHKEGHPSPEFKNAKEAIDFIIKFTELYK